MIFSLILYSLYVYFFVFNGLFFILQCFICMTVLRLQASVYTFNRISIQQHYTLPLGLKREKATTERSVSICSVCLCIYLCIYRYIYIYLDTHTQIDRQIKKNIFYCPIYLCINLYKGWAVNVSLLSGDYKISSLVYSQSWVGAGSILYFSADKNIYQWTSVMSF